MSASSFLCLALFTGSTGQGVAGRGVGRLTVKRKRRPVPPPKTSPAGYLGSARPRPPLAPPGETLKLMKKRGELREGNPKLSQAGTVVTLEDIGLTRNQSSRYQQEADPAG